MLSERTLNDPAKGLTKAVVFSEAIHRDGRAGVSLRKTEPRNAAPISSE